MSASLPTKRRPRILLRSSWQTVNIGDISHTPGLLSLLEKHLPGVAVTLWPNRLDNGVDALLQRAFPDLTICDGALDEDGAPLSESMKRAYEECYFFLHGSGPHLMCRLHIESWLKHKIRLERFK